MKKRPVPIASHVHIEDAEDTTERVPNGFKKTEREEMETWEEENKKQAELERLFDELFGDIDTSEKSESKEAESGTEQKQSVSEL